MNVSREKWPSRLKKCACRDCTVECLGVLCQRCEASECAADGSEECCAPNAYALSARRTEPIER